MDYSSISKRFALAIGITASFASPSWACSGDSPFIGSICVVPYVRGCPTGFVKADGRSLPVNQYQALYSLIGNIFGGNQQNFNVPNLNGRMPVGVGPATQLIGQPPTTAVSLGQNRGAENTTLTANQLPVHNHSATFTPTTGQQAVTIPGQSGSGAITATAATDIVPGNSGVDPAPNVSNYYLTGVTTAAAGPVTTNVPGTDKSTLIGTHVTINTSTYKPSVDAQTVNINVVNGGSVAVGANPTQGVGVPTLPPQLGLYYCIATQGLYPMFD